MKITNRSEYREDKFLQQITKEIGDEFFKPLNELITGGINLYDDSKSNGKNRGH
jgi:hypothetical protein